MFWLVDVLVVLASAYLCPKNCLLPLLPLKLANLSLFLLLSQLQHVFCLSFSVSLHEKSESKITESSVKLPQVTCSWRVSVTRARWWRPGRAETSRHGEEGMSACIRSPCAPLVVWASLTHPPLSPRFLTFPVAPPFVLWTVLSVRFYVKLRFLRACL